MDRNYKLKKYRLLKSELLKRYKGKFIFNFELGRIDGSDKFGNMFIITISNTDTVLTVTPTTSPKIIKELSSIIYMIMCARPICQYELKYFGISMRTIEWDIAAPEERIMNLVQGKNVFIDNPKIHNLHLFGGRKIKEYKRLKTEDIDKIEGENEFILYYEISNLSKTLAATDSPAPEQFNYLTYLIKRTQKYGIDFKPGAKLAESESLKIWLSYWNDFKNSLSKEDIEALIIAIDKGKDVSKILPKNTWQDYLDSGLKNN